MLLLPKAGAERDESRLNRLRQCPSHRPHPILNAIPLPTTLPPSSRTSSSKSVGDSSSFNLLYLFERELRIPLGAGTNPILTSLPTHTHLTNRLRLPHDLKSPTISLSLPVSPILTSPAPKMNRPQGKRASKKVMLLGEKPKFFLERKRAKSKSLVVPPPWFFCYKGAPREP